MVLGSNVEVHIHRSALPCDTRAVADREVAVHHVAQRVAEAALAQRERTLQLQVAVDQVHTHAAVTPAA